MTAEAPLTKGSIVYTFATPYRDRGKTLFVNIVPKYECTNDCRFCSRKDAIANLPNIYEKKADTRLWLPRAPTVSEVLDALTENSALWTAEEVSFVGLGEPLLQRDLLCDCIREIRCAGFGGHMRLDTNGCIGDAITSAKLKLAGLDEIRISVNATNTFDYAELCRPKVKDAHERICAFVRSCAQAGLNTYASFVVGFDDGAAQTRPAGKYQAFAETEFGLDLDSDYVIIRPYVPSLFHGP